MQHVLVRSHVWRNLWDLMRGPAAVGVQYSVDSFSPGNRDECMLGWSKRLSNQIAGGTAREGFDIAYQ